MREYNMELLVLDKNFEVTNILDVFESLIWTDRYYECGDFEVYTAANTEMLNILKTDYYLYSESSEHSMIIEDIKIESDSEEGNYLTVTGNSLESILKRRIIWKQTVLSGDFQDAIEQLLDENIISPEIENRKIDNFIFVKSDDEYITSLTIDTQFTGDNLYEAIQSMCQNVDVGFKVVLNLEEKQFEFSLYYGKDRSYNQDENPHVVFSPTFENLVDSNYDEKYSNYKNVALIAGEDESDNRKTISIGNGDYSGLDRRELYVDARDISTTDDNGNTITDEQYYAELTQRGEEELIEYKVTKTFDGEAETTQMYKYGTDFFMGDICQFENEYGMERQVRVTEFIYSEDTNGIKSYPTFTAIDEDEEDE
jgi:hypothetical protein